jgi:zinc protease
MMLTSLRVAAAALLLASTASGAPQVQESKLANGSPLLAATDSGPPRQIVTVIFETGCKVLPKGQAAAASILEYLLQEGPLGKTTAEYRRDLFLLNASINATISPRGFYLVVAAPPNTLKAALQKTTELLAKPKLTEDQLKIAQQRSISRRRAQDQDMRFLADYVAQRYLYAPHPDAYSCTGSSPEIESLKLEDLKKDWTVMTQPSRLIFGTVGPMAVTQVRSLIESTVLKDGKVRYEAEPALPIATFRKPSSPGGTDVILLEQPDAQDNQVLFIWPQDLKADTPEFAVGEMALTLLGGGFSGRLQQELREKRGLTYGAYGFISDSQPHYMGASFAGGDNIGRLIQELPQVYQAFIEENQTEERLGIAKESLVTAFRDSTELPLDGFVLALNARFFGRDPNAWRNRIERWEAVTVASLQQFIKTRMNQKPAYLVVVGDPKALLPALEQAGYPKQAIKTVKPDEL